jgi:hypothetical protein
MMSITRSTTTKSLNEAGEDTRLRRFVLRLSINGRCSRRRCTTFVCLLLFVLRLVFVLVRVTDGGSDVG